MLFRSKNLTKQLDTLSVKSILNDKTKNKISDEEIKGLAKLLGIDSSEETIELAHCFISSYRSIIEEIVRSLSLEGPGVCVLEDVFSEEYMDKFQAWVEEYLEQDTQEKKDHFAFGTNKRIWRVPEKLPPNLLYSYLQFDADSEDHRTPAFNHVIDR